MKRKETTNGAIPKANALMSRATHATNCSTVIKKAIGFTGVVTIVPVHIEIALSKTEVRHMLPSFTAEVSLEHMFYIYAGRSRGAPDRNDTLSAVIKTANSPTAKAPPHYPCTRKVSNASCRRDYQTGIERCEGGHQGQTCYEIIYDRQCSLGPEYPPCQ